LGRNGSAPSLSIQLPRHGGKGAAKGLVISAGHLVVEQGEKGGQVVTTAMLDYLPRDVKNQIITKGKERHIRYTVGESQEDSIEKGDL